MQRYGQYCPMSRAAEILATRWTLVIVRNMLLGCETFGEIADGAPGISHTLLSQRLDLLHRSGIIDRVPNPRGRGSRYLLTEAGRDLGAVCQAMGRWGLAWLEAGPEDLDPYVVLWGLCREIDRSLLPERRIVARFEFSDAPTRARSRLWLVMQRPEPEVCRKPPGFDEDLVVRTSSEWLMNWHLGRVSVGQGMREARVEVVGPRHLIRELCAWGGQSVFAEQAAGAPPPVEEALAAPAEA